MRAEVEGRIFSRIVGALLLATLAAACEGDPAAPVADPPVGLARPVVPADLTATPDLGSIELEWPDSPDETHYQLGRAPAPLGTEPRGRAYTLIASPTANVTVFTDGGVEPGTRYRYRLRACNADGCGPYQYVYVTTLTPPPPGTPADLLGDPADGDVVLTWTDVAGETSYNLTRAPAPLGLPEGTAVSLPNPPADAITLRDERALPGTRYRYRIRACNAGGCSPYASTFVVTPSLPNEPAGFAATVESDGDVVLVWTDGTGETGYEIDRAVALGGTQPTDRIDLASLGANVVTYSDESTEIGTRYRYRIRACNLWGCSPFAAIRVQIDDPPFPTEIHGVVVNDRDKDVTTVDRGEALEGVTIRLYADNSGAPTVDEDSLVATTRTRADGSYIFPRLREGRYIIKAVQPTNAIVLSRFLSTGVAVDTQIVFTTAIAPSSSAANEDGRSRVGNTRPPLPRWDYDDSDGIQTEPSHFTYLQSTGTARGTVFNGDSSSGIRRVTVTARLCYQTTGSVSPPGPGTCGGSYLPGVGPRVTVTDANGGFSFTGLREGVWEIMPLPGTVGYTSMTPTARLFRLDDTGDTDTGTFRAYP